MSEVIKKSAEKGELSIFSFSFIHYKSIEGIKVYRIQKTKAKELLLKNNNQ